MFILSGRAKSRADTFSDMFSGVPGNMNNAIEGFNRFWQSVFIYACVSIAMQVAGLFFSSIALNIFGAILAGMGVVALQTEYV
ncbi:hypothetical protein IQ249_09055 [Lusitaniella coriacea LEGE 07157]|uniref:Uncharacterized protein n=1 Tax=Lusitaniella coriacea LEGE 07157 TaxID=945747 RepID=A0A8J7DVV0_9CYAN|nr:hypothetical protein [Lusitaniella coriacea]MBE9116041.1 hypothetical protein [Lusitaniella coriacea LEGE 07157]